MVETISDVIYAVDAKGGVDYISPVIDSILGYSASEIVGRHFGELFAKEDRDRFRGHYEKIAAGHSTKEECFYRLIFLAINQPVAEIRRIPSIRAENATHVT